MAAVDQAAAGWAAVAAWVAVARDLGAAGSVVAAEEEEVGACCSKVARCPTASRSGSRNLRSRGRKGIHHC